MPIFTRGIVGPDVSIAGVGEQNVGANVGGGAGVYRDKTGVSLNFRSLIGGTGITVTQNADDIDIALTNPIGEANTAVNVGAGTGNIFRDKTGVNLNLKTLIEGTNVSIVDGADDITFNVPSASPSGAASGMLSGTYPGPDVINFTLSGEATGDITFHNAGQWDVLAAGTPGQILTTQGAGSAPTWETITPGETNVGANVGGNPGLVFRDKTGSTLNFRTIGAGSNVVVDTVGDSVSISVPDAPPSGGAGGDLDGFYPNPDVIDLTMTGEVQGSILYFNGVNWVVLTPGTSGYALITQGVSANPVWGFVGDIAGGANLGTGDGNVFAGKSGSTLRFRSLEGLGNIDVDTAGDNVTIDGSNLIGRGESAGGDLGGTYPDPTVTDLTITDEEQGSILYFDGANWVQLAPGDPDDILKSGGTGADPYWSDVGADGEINEGVNVGTGFHWYRDKTGVYLNFRTAIEGTNVEITNLGNELRFDVFGAEPIGIAGGELTGTYPDPDLANIYFNHTLRNAFGGVNAGQGATTTGVDNAAWGDGALASLVDGIQNSAGGSRALESLVSGSNSTAWGFRALAASIEGNNTGFGSLAGANLVTGTRNTFFGEAGSALTQGSDNLLGGFAAGSNLTQGSRNIVLGSSLLVPNSIGDDQLVIGSLTGLIFGNLSSGLLAIGGSTIPTGSAELALRSTDKGFVPNRLTTAQKNAISFPIDGMLVYDIDNNRLEYYEGTWQPVAGSGAGTIGGTIDDIPETPPTTRHQIAFSNGLDTIQGDDGFQVYQFSADNQIGIQIGEIGTDWTFYAYKRDIDAGFGVGGPVPATDPTIWCYLNATESFIYTLRQDLEIKGFTTERVLINTVDILETGPGTNFLADDGTYKPVSGSGGFKAEEFTYTDITNKVIGPLTVTPSEVAGVNLFPEQSVVQMYTVDYTVRQVTGGSAPGYYVCISTTSTAPGGGSFVGGSNPGTGIDSVLSSGDKVRVMYPT